MDQDTTTPWSPKDALLTLEQLDDRPAILAMKGGEAVPVSGTELRQSVFGAAAVLKENGVGPGSVVAIWAPNSPEWIAAALACHLLGAILAPIDALVPADEAADQIIASGASVALLDGDPPGALGERMTCLDLRQIPRHETGPPFDDLDTDHPVAQFRTSGTTGQAKVFRLNIGNIASNVQAIADTGLVSTDDRVLMPLPLHHVFPWITATLTCLTVGAPMILPESATGPHIAEALRTGRATIIVGVPRLYEAMLTGIRGRIASRGRPATLIFDAGTGLAKGLRSIGLGGVATAVTAPFRRAIAPDLRLLVSGGAHLPLEIEQALEAIGWDVRVGYGLAETAASVTAPSAAKRMGSVGLALSGTTIRIDRPGDDGTGEILISGPTVFSGYIDNPDADAEAFTDDRYFRTGDLGRLDDDGFVYITGRKKEVIVLPGGDNLYPEEVEKAYLDDPQIGEIGVMDRDGALVALIVPDLAETAKAGWMNAEDAIRVSLGSTAKRLPSTWRLAGFALTREPLPRTRLGKLKRFELPELYDRAKSEGSGHTARPLSAEDRQWIETPPRDAVWAILEGLDDARPFDLDSHLQLDLGLDSFAWMTLGVAIDEATGVRLDEADVAAIATVRNLLARVSDKAAGAGNEGPAMAETLAAERARWLTPRTAAERALGKVVELGNSAVMRLFFRLRVHGAETLPEDGPVIICPNHVSDIDAFAVAAALPSKLRRRVVWAATHERLFSTRFRRAFSRAVRGFPVNETMPNIAIELAVDSLANDGVQVWFPEGWRSPDGRLLPFHPGIGLIVERSGAPVVPTFISGSEEALPRERALPRPVPVTVTFGPPIPAETLIAKAADDANSAQAIADSLRTTIADIAKTDGVQTRDS
ncbi:AMP-binding protein [Bauldia sp.]|uniref:AMP-binding protein n=1 Tax=Bauldia sp. TaxID=2575872 RepID=UPI003BABDDE2